MNYIRVIDYDVETGLGIIRCNQRLVDVLRSFIEKMPTASIDLVSAEVLGVSGTIKALKQKFLQTNL
jgi:RNase P/RNase MRP subunit POP5